MEIPKFFRVVPIEEREPPFMKFVPTIDEAGEIIFFRRTVHGYNMRDGQADNSPNNNLKILSWLEPCESCRLTDDELEEKIVKEIKFEEEDAVGNVKTDYTRLGAFIEGAKWHRDNQNK